MKHCKTLLFAGVLATFVGIVINEARAEKRFKENRIRRKEKTAGCSKVAKSEEQENKDVAASDSQEL